MHAIAMQCPHTYHSRMLVCLIHHLAHYSMQGGVSDPVCFTSIYPASNIVQSVCMYIVRTYMHYIHSIHVHTYILYVLMHITYIYAFIMYAVYCVL